MRQLMSMPWIIHCLSELWFFARRSRRDQRGRADVFPFLRRGHCNGENPLKEWPQLDALPRSVASRPTAARWGNSGVLVREAEHLGNTALLAMGVLPTTGAVTRRADAATITHTRACANAA